MSFDDIDPIHHIFVLQREMQIANSKKRPAICCPKDPDKSRQLEASMYYWNCATVEFFEFEESFKELYVDGVELHYQKAYADVAEELIDILHFIVSMLLYIGIKPKDVLPIKELDKYISHGSIISSERPIESYEKSSDVIFDTWGKISWYWGRILNQLPYKIWKTYDEPEYKQLVTEANGFLIAFFYLFRMIELSPEQVYEKYLEKNQINKDRQGKGGRYEK